MSCFFAPVAIFILFRQERKTKDDRILGILAEKSAKTKHRAAV